MGSAKIRILVLTLIAHIMFVLPISVGASESTMHIDISQPCDSSDNIEDWSDVVIGMSYPTLKANLLPNLLTVDYVATATCISITYTNFGLDTVDTVSSSVTINGVTKKVIPFSAPIGITTKNVYFDLKQCHEEIMVVTKASDGGDSFAAIQTPGHRDLPQRFVETWHPGSFGSPEASINYHFAKHGLELGIQNIQSYVASALAFRTHLSGATQSSVFGAISGVTRYKKSGKYIDICGFRNTGLIVSYGKQ